MTTPLDPRAEFERAALDSFYQTDREFRSAALGLSLAGSLALLFEYRATAFVLFALSVVCQIISWRALRGAHRLEQKRLERIQGGGHG